MCVAEWEGIFTCTPLVAQHGRIPWIPAVIELFAVPLSLLDGAHYTAVCMCVCVKCVLVEPGRAQRQPTGFHLGGSESSDFCTYSQADIALGVAEMHKCLWFDVRVCGFASSVWTDVSHPATPTPVLAQNSPRISLCTNQHMYATAHVQTLSTWVSTTS